MNLYEIKAEIEAAILVGIDMETGELVNLQAVSDLQEEFNEKVDNIACYIKNLNAEAAALREEEKRLAERRKVKERKSDRLKGYLQDALQGQRFESPRTQITFRHSQTVQITDEALVPAKFQRIKVEPMKVEIAREIKAGRPVPGCELVPSESVVIK